MNDFTSNGRKFGECNPKVPDILNGPINGSGQESMGSEWLVYKFGGSSVGNPVRLPLVLNLIERSLAPGRRTAVVISALGDTTDWLIAAVDASEQGDAERATKELNRARLLALEIASRVLSPNGAKEFEQEIAGTFSSADVILEPLGKGRLCTQAQRDVVLAVGELTAVALVALALRERGIPAHAVDARGFLVTDGLAVDWSETCLRFADSPNPWREGVPVVTGFIARNGKGEPTNLGRNGSDYTAAILAALLRADSVTVWTDVPGVMTADPGLVAEALSVDRLSYDEALELAYFGTRMFHPRTVIPLRERGIELYIRSTIDQGASGTRIDAEGNTNPNRPTCVTSLENLAMLSVHSRRAELGKPIAGSLTSALRMSGISVWLMTESTLGQSFSVLVPEPDHARATLLVQLALGSELKRKELFMGPAFTPVSMVTLVGNAICAQPNAAGRFLGSVGRAGIPVRAVAHGASQRSISCVVDAVDTSLAVRSVHTAFNLAHAEISVFLLGKGIVGRSLLEQLHTQGPVLRDHHDVNLRLVGLGGRSGALFKANGMDPLTAEHELNVGIAEERAPPQMKANLGALSRLPNPVLVDCTAANGMEELYAYAFSLGINVVSANKKPLSLPRAKDGLLKRAARQHYRAYHYSTTVGAALPIIETLKNLIRTGDRVRLIEGSFSGTLGFLCERLSMGEPLSTAVRLARTLGFTEPHPRDDLAGVDVARKALILARELGLEADYEDVLLQPFVTTENIPGDDVEGFIESLSSIDASTEEQMRPLRESGRLLRYLARIEPETGRVTVGPVDVGADHPAAALRGSEAFVAFHTERYSEYPLIVRGSGAGGAVTASGVMADILKLAQNLRGW